MTQERVGGSRWSLDPAAQTRQCQPESARLMVRNAVDKKHGSMAVSLAVNSDDYGSVSAEGGS